MNPSEKTKLRKKRPADETAASESKKAKHPALAMYGTPAYREYEYQIVDGDDQDGLLWIQCDHCDEWYPIAAQNVAKEELEIIDKFFCSVCRATDPNLMTTYKNPNEIEIKTEPADDADPGMDMCPATSSRKEDRTGSPPLPTTPRSSASNDSGFFSSPEASPEAKGKVLMHYLTGKPIRLEPLSADWLRKPHIAAMIREFRKVIPNWTDEQILQALREEEQKDRIWLNIV